MSRKEIYPFDYELERVINKWENTNEPLSKIELSWVMYAAKEYYNDRYIHSSWDNASSLEIGWE